MGETATVDDKATERQHMWVAQPHKAGDYWEERRCLRCGLQDMRRHDRSEKHFRNEWSVTTPCIEPVEPLVAYDDLMAELEQHGVREHPLCVGVPGDWAVGFSIGSGRVYPLLQIGKMPLEHGFSLLLCWIRARQYDVNRYSDFSYQRRLADHTCACCDDD